MDRRVFLQSMAALAIAASTATVVPEVAATVAKPNKYKEAIRLFDRCVAVSQDTKEVSARFDVMMKHLRENFEVPEYSEETVQALADFLNNPVDIAGIRRIPPTVADSIYTVALTKLALTSYKMSLNPGLMTEFDWFHENYGPMIIASCDRSRRKVKQVA
jgi:hypothetical protein